MKTLDEISAVLRQRLQDENLAAESVCDSAGIPQQVLAALLSGEHDYPVSVLMAVADSLGLELVLVPRQAVRGIQDEWAVQSPSVPSLVEAALARLK